MTSGSTGESDLYNPTIRSIALEDRREILKTLGACGPLPAKTLAEKLADRDTKTPPPDERHVHGVRTKLVHAHLPALRDVGLIAWDRGNDLVATADHPALTDPRFERLLNIESDGLDDVLTGLCHEYRRIVLTLLWAGRDTMERNALAKEILRYREREGGADSVTKEDVAVALHHSHLPKLSERDIIEYRTETERAIYTHHPALEEVFTTIYTPEDQVTDKLDEFLRGLHHSYQETEQETRHLVNWPHEWGSPHYG